MIEEASGTKMYESKKQSALRTIEKKDARLAEIGEVGVRSKFWFQILIQSKGDDQTQCILHKKVPRLRELPRTH